MNVFDPSKLDIDFSKDDETNKIDETKTNLDSNNTNDNDSLKEKKIISNKDNFSETVPVKNLTNNTREVEKEDTNKNLEDDSKKSLSTNQNNEDISTIITDIDLQPEEIRQKRIEKAEKESKQWEIIDDNNKTINFDINIKNIDDLLLILQKNKYDFFVAEPYDNYVRILFKKQKVVKETRYLKFMIYSKVLLDTKKICSLKIEDNSIEQKGEWVYNKEKISYNILSKTVPWEYWEKLFLRILEISAKKIDKTKTSTNKISIWKAFAFLWVLLMTMLIVGWAFLAFILFNSESLADIYFFYELWINISNLKTFVANLISIVFWALVLIEVIFTMIFLFRAFITKKDFKRKKIVSSMIWIILLLATMFTFYSWMLLNKKIYALKTLDYGKIFIYDNSKLLDENFNKNKSIIKDTSDLIWPVTLKIDLKNFLQKLNDDGFSINKVFLEYKEYDLVERPVNWNFDISFIKSFSSKWQIRPKLTITWKNLKWEFEKKEFDLNVINISYIVDVEEETQELWWKVLSFDASSLKELGNIEWWLLENIWSKDDFFTGPIFKPAKIFYEDDLVIMRITNDDWDILREKILVISWESSADISWKIVAEQSLDDDLVYTFYVKDAKTNFSNWFIEKFKWSLWNDKTIIKDADKVDIDESSRISFKFNYYWKHNISVLLIDSAWKSKLIPLSINIPKKLSLRKTLDIYNSNLDLIESLTYDKKNYEYEILDLAVPTTLSFDARKVRPDSTIYKLDFVEWDFWNDWNIDKKWNQIDFSVDTEWYHQIKLIYNFVHRRKTEDVVKMSEFINIQWVKKEAILSLDIIKDTEYVPAIVKFDASKSKVKNDNIVKFIFNYWDWTWDQEGDSINPGHKYVRAGDYTVKLRVVTEKGKEYSIDKKLILKPKPQKAEISVSMKRAPVYQWIDFSSDPSVWQIANYLWDFWDGEVSTDANPSHFYKKTWTYKVKLTLEFTNKNILSDEEVIFIED